MKQKTSTMLKNILHGANRRPYSVTLYTIFYTYVKETINTGHRWIHIIMNCIPKVS